MLDHPELYMHYSKIIKGCVCRWAVLAGGKKRSISEASETILMWPFVFQFSACKMGKILELFIFGKCLFFLNRNSAHVIFYIWGKKEFFELSQFQKWSKKKPRSLLSKTKVWWLTQMDIFVLLAHNDTLKIEKTEFLTFFFLEMQLLFPAEL